MQILISENKKSWDQFLLENDGSFLQSWDWGEFQLKQGKKVWRFQAEDGKSNILAQFQVQKEVFPFQKSMLYVPLGPCFKSNLFLKDKKKMLNLFLKSIRKIARNENTIFLKIEPPVILPKMEEAMPSKKRIQPKKIMVLSLMKEKSEIFQNFHPKTRYNIKLSQKKGVNVIKIQNKEEKLSHLKFFWKILQKTAKRGRFKTYFKNYYKDMLCLDNTLLYLGEYNKKIIVANIILYFNKTAFYLHGASDYKYRKIMAPHLLHWWQICDAKESGCQNYDFGGVDEKRWPGLTRFKKSFGAELVEYPQGKDFVFQKNWYKLYNILRKKI